MSQQAVCADGLPSLASASQVIRELSDAGTVSELLDTAHRMWCGTACGQGPDCTFLHYPRIAPPARPARSARSRYNKDTAGLFSLMGGGGYVPGTPQVHEMNLWSLLRPVIAEIDSRGSGAQDYCDWSGKDARSASELVLYACRDSIQWVASWCGSRYARQPAGVHYIAFCVICDDLCIPPTDLVRGRFRMYGRSAADLASAMDDQGWGPDGSRALLSLVREYVLQYAEKAHPGVHPSLNRLDGVWDAVVYRTHSASVYGGAIVAGRVCQAGPASFTWLMDSSVCDAISMDLCKSAMDIYSHDQYQPTAHDRYERRRQAAYHSVYLDLIDDLVVSGAPDDLVHFGRAGFLFVQMQERYRERRLGHRLPLRTEIATRLREMFGTAPADPLTDQMFRKQPTPVLAIPREDNQEILTRPADTGSIPCQGTLGTAR